MKSRSVVVPSSGRRGLVIIAFCALATVACTSSSRLVEASAPRVSCDAGQISIADVRKNDGVTSFSAHCPNDERWICDSNPKNSETKCWREDVEPEIEVQDEFLSLPPSPVTATPAPWRTVDLDVCPLSGILPGEVKKGAVPGAPEGSVSAHFSSIFQDRTFALACVKIPGLKPEAADLVMRAGADSMAHAVGGTVQSYALTDGQPGVNAVVLDPPEQQALVVRMFVVEDFLIQALAGPSRAHSSLGTHEVLSGHRTDR